MMPARERPERDLEPQHEQLWHDLMEQYAGVASGSTAGLASHFLGSKRDVVDVLRGEGVEFEDGCAIEAQRIACDELSGLLEALDADGALDEPALRD